MRPIDLQTDLYVINRWMRAHGKRGFSPDELPEIGFIVEDVAAAFMYQTDSTVAFLENFVSSPSAKPKSVARALDAIVKELRHVASMNGISRLVVFSKVRSIGKRIGRLGFQLKGDWQGYSAEVRQWAL
jgi:hypothetical protein